ncbi:prepilin peptidase [Effusibacillus consociatus]|uniref:Prepilin peptidase n=1 Tax=Effusibacillus consociatus TaxID=1117041 RepID=A0ABV9Q2I4_9BACL
MVEAITGFLWGMVAWRFGWSWETAIGLLFVSFLLPLAVIDIHEMILPNVLTFPLIGAALTGRLLIGSEPFRSYLAGGLLGAGLLLLLWWLSPYLFGKEGMGLGDVKLMAGIGLVVGLQGAILALFISSLIGLLIGLVVVTKNKAAKQEYLPFGPFLALGGLVSYLFGESVWNLFFY